MPAIFSTSSASPTTSRSFPRSHALSGWDSLLSIVQMPGGIPVATTAVGNSGATNAGLLAVQMLSAFEPELADKLEDYRNELKEKVAESNAQLV